MTFTTVTTVKTPRANAKAHENPHKVLSMFGGNRGMFFFRSLFDTDRFPTEFAPVSIENAVPSDKVFPDNVNVAEVARTLNPMLSRMKIANKLDRFLCSDLFLIIFAAYVVISLVAAPFAGLSWTSYVVPAVIFAVIFPYACRVAKHKETRKEKRQLKLEREVEQLGGVTIPTNALVLADRKNSTASELYCKVKKLEANT